MKQFMISKLGRGQDGNVAVEFALIAPILLLIVAAVVNIGSAGIISQRLNVHATAAADYTLLQPPVQDEPSARALATTLVGLLQSSGNASAEVVVNNAVAAQWTGESITNSGGGGDPTRCYCPTRSGGDITWGAPRGCNTPCETGEMAGQFVEIRLSAQHIPLVSGFGLRDKDTVEVSTMVRLP